MKKSLDIHAYLTNFKNYIKKLVITSFYDKVTVYAAQACYFVIVSAIPFLCLIISIASYLIPADIYSVVDTYKMPPEIEAMIRFVLEQLFATQKISLLSLSAIFAIWTASRGCDALRAGIENVYGVPASKKIFKQQALSIVNTFVLILVIMVNIIFVLFGELIAKALHLTAIYELIMSFGSIILFIVMCWVFGVIYSSTAKHSKDEKIRTSTKHHIPGSVFSTVGWMIFSYFYSLYIRFFPSASAIYGSLTAVLLIMLWLYVCIIILLLGAEVNKLWILRDEESAVEDTENIKDTSKRK
ncbi:MAG: YihY/virulence factor BrkB family protein [Agathobacter sp.]|nr:YihY/virulence factor BrkB family protein [Agathobacter sp.]